MIERNDYQSQTFMTELKTMVSTLVNVVRNDIGKTISIEEKTEKEVAPKKKSTTKAPKSKPEKKVTAKADSPKTEVQQAKNPTELVNANEVQQSNLCPICHTGVILKGKTAFGCSNWNNGCKFRIPFSFNGHTFVSSELTQLTNLETLTVGDKKVHLSAEGELTETE